MDQVTRLQISPPNSMLVIAGLGASNTPIPDGIATVVASDDTILVMTQYEPLGLTEVTVSLGSAGNWPSLDLIEVFDGKLRTPGGVLQLQDIALKSYARFESGTDETHVRVAVDRDIEPMRVEIAIDCASAGAGPA